MKQPHKRLLALLLSLVAAFSLLSAPAQAAVHIDTGRACRLNIQYTHASSPISGARFDLYRVADVDAYGAFTLSGDFSAYPVLVNGLDSAAWRALAETLTGFAQRDALKPLDSGMTTASGDLAFPTSGGRLSTGLYLVVGHPSSDGTYLYTPESFLVSLPSLDENDIWRYDMSASPKHTRTDARDPDPGSSTVARRVLKLWDDGESPQRPAQVIMYLLRNGVVYDQVVLTAAGSWRWHWDELPKYDENDLLIDWQVVEETVGGYTVSVTREGVTFVVTNTLAQSPAGPDDPNPPVGPSDPDHPEYPDTPDEPDHPTVPDYPSSPDTPSSDDDSRLPQTGQLWLPVPLLAALGLICLLCGALSRRRERGDE